MIEFIIGLFYVIIIANGVVHCIDAFSEEYGQIKEAFVEEAEILAAAKEPENIVLKPDTSAEVMNDAVGGLVSVGYGRRESRRAVAEVVENKPYTDPMEIIQDILSKQ